jgi:O-succinylbenzoic acid--CoA ligase
MVVEGWLERAARTAPSRTAIETPRGSRSYAELLADARAAAAELTRRGVTPGERVAIALPPGLAFAQALHACLLLGAVAVPVDLRMTAAEQEQVSAGAAVRIDEPLSSAPVRSAAVPPRAGHELRDTAVVIHTSGTTAAPKPVQLTYGNFLWSALGSAVALGLDPQERWLCALPLSHVGGLSILMRSAIYGTTAVVHERFDTELVLHALREQRITLVSLVATTLARLLDAGLESGRAPRPSQSSRPLTLRCALTGGGPVPEALLARARDAGVPVALTYGLTESCSQATTTPLAAIGEDRGAAGTPLFCTRVRIAEAATARVGEPLPGEILLAGPTLAPRSLDEAGWLHTGDLGSLDEQGRLRVTGRASETIVSGGENVAPSEVEAALETHPDVLEAAAIGRPDPRWGEAVTAIVVPRPGAQPREETLREYCAASLAPYKVPKRIILTATQLPRTRSGKRLRRELT